jgi:hypothetical protein
MQFREYVILINRRLFPLQIITFINTLYICYLLFYWPGTWSDVFIKSYLALNFALLGAANLMYVKTPAMKKDFTKAAGLTFVIALLFVVDIFPHKMQFRVEDKNKPLFLLLTAYVLFIYPVIEWLTVKRINQISFYGVFPCPTLVFTIALFAASVPHVDLKVFIVVLLFALSAGIYGPVKNAVYANLGTGIVGIYGLFVLVSNWDKIIHR